MNLTLGDYFTHTGAPTETRAHAVELLARVNALLSEIDLAEAEAPVVTSGWRPAWYNATVPNASPKSKHITGQAIDIADPEGALDDFLFHNQEALKQHDLYLEHPLATKGWVHLQSIPPRSGNRVFYP